MADEDARQNRVELLATVLLALAAVATAWSSYQGARWRGEQAVQTSKATAAHIESSEASTRAGQLTQVDIATFTQWVDATVAGNTELATFYERRFRDEFRPAFDAWLATQPLTDPDAPLTPFAMPDYKLAEADRASQVNREAGEHADAAGAANRNADEYLLAVVLFATALFFAALSGKLRTQVAREVVLGLGAVIFLGAVAWLVTFPVSITG
jgi:hypothetical protein